ncbi:MAG: transcriptional regulator [Thiotrichales bacterium]|nr:MAG: transcriptional regulator [Thiotrichales bacterium]
MNKSILEVVHDSAKGLHKAGIMKTITMREFDALCLPPIKELSAIQIKQLRLREKVSQAVFAIYINVSKSTIRQWEQGERHPTGSSLKLLNLIYSNGLVALT